MGKCQWKETVEDEEQMKHRSGKNISSSINNIGIQEIRLIISSE